MYWHEAGCALNIGANAKGLNVDSWPKSEKARDPQTPRKSLVGCNKGARALRKAEAGCSHPEGLVQRVLRAAGTKAAGFCRKVRLLLLLLLPLLRWRRGWRRAAARRRRPVLHLEQLQAARSRDVMKAAACSVQQRFVSS